ncbi:hypothetical protein QNH23_06515 [Siminovitchia fortis]|uniref:hypothetical protein n=1 Tax=Siminovitchia fortis TaxID=254758 RepID=UPI0013E2ECD1|nr:hypothetical protein [Siminovitchia fortis]WHY83025.1 hypothetical protein QNH23_06515 [Siminovitchia fortis]
MNEKIMKIQRDLQEEYLQSIEKIEGPGTKQLFEQMIKLNAEMIAKALQKYEES